MWSHCLLLIYSALILCKIAGVMGSCGLDGTPTCIPFMPRITSFNLGIELMWGSSIPWDICRCLTADKYDLAVLWRGPSNLRNTTNWQSCFLIMAELVLPDARSNSGTSFCLHCTLCGWKGLDLLGTGYKLFCPAARHPVRLLHYQQSQCLLWNWCWLICASGTTCRNSEALLRDKASAAIFLFPGKCTASTKKWWCSEIKIGSVYSRYIMSLSLL